MPKLGASTAYFNAFFRRSLMYHDQRYYIILQYVKLAPENDAMIGKLRLQLRTPWKVSCSQILHFIPYILTFKYMSMIKHDNIFSKQARLMRKSQFNTRKRQRVPQGLDGGTGADTHVYGYRGGPDKAP